MSLSSQRPFFFGLKVLAHGHNAEITSLAAKLDARSSLMKYIPFISPTLDLLLKENGGKKEKEKPVHSKTTLEIRSKLIIDFPTEEKIELRPLPG
ncbi:hypothetical protein AVEN_28598-1 [Araneus ventricosus]|uniref:Uncharacterized protein n=1 Tax=Araneus ventricosus TaxID=182803 RepID=A0A4Y2DDX5_ARAVE|nr:hypothetical protein AVEN_28598-1 [Araneus ventricosus]